MPSLSLLATPAPWHILAYGTLLGTTFFQSFVGGIVAFRCLPRPQFSTLQQNIFPVYFALQTALPAALVFTYPATVLGSGGWSAALDNAAAGSGAGVSILVMFLGGLLNAAVLGPATTKCMRERKHQGRTAHPFFYSLAHLCNLPLRLPTLPLQNRTVLFLPAPLCLFPPSPSSFLALLPRVLPYPFFPISPH